MELADIYKTLVPSNARFLLDSALGNTNTITEKDFSPEELGSLKSIYQTKQQDNARAPQDIASHIVSEDDFNQNPTSRLVENGPNRYTSRQETYKEYLQRQSDKINSFSRTPNKTSVGYPDYPDKMAAPTHDSYPEAIYKSYTDPSYRLKTILGSFNGYDQGPSKISISNCLWSAFWGRAGVC